MAEETITADSTDIIRDFSEPWDESDVTFIVEDKKLHANKAILSMWSPVFKAMFRGDFKEKTMDEIPLPGKKYGDVIQLLRATHPPLIDITDENIETILQLSREYQISPIIKMCESHLVTKPPSVRNLIIAREYGMPSLEKICKEYAKNTPWEKLKKENDLDDLVQDACAEVFKERIDMFESFAATQEKYVAILKEIQDITIIKETDCKVCKYNICVDCGADASSGPYNSYRKWKNGNCPRICSNCACSRFRKTHDKLAKLDIRSQR